MAKKRRKASKGAIRRKKIAKKRVVPKKKRRSVKKAVKRVTTKKKAPGRAKAPGAKRSKLPAEPIGKVTHFFGKAHAAAVMIERESIRVGDTLYFKGHTTNFKQRVESLQINQQPVTDARPGDEVGIEVRSRTREHDLVFKL